MGPIPDYRNLDQTDEAHRAAWRMEMRGRETSSQLMFEALVAPLFSERTRKVLEFGCGTACLSRRVAKTFNQADVLATDSSETMISVAQSLIDEENSSVRTHVWDVTRPDSFPEPDAMFDMILSSVVVPYLSDQETLKLIDFLSERLSTGGNLCFVEQDLMTDSVASSFPKVADRIFAKDKRQFPAWNGLRLRELLNRSDLQLHPIESFLWTDHKYGPYTNELLTRLAQNAVYEGRITQAESDGFLKDQLYRAQNSQAYYGLVYHRVAARRR